VADVTFFRRVFGVLVLRDPHRKRNLHWHAVPTETVAAYRYARQALERRGFSIQAVVLDGRPGVREVFSDLPVQMCHFHQAAIITRYLTRHPKLPAGVELKSLAADVAGTAEDELAAALAAWHTRWAGFLRERTYAEDGRHWHYTHRRIRGAYRSLMTNLPYLFTFKRYPGLGIPTTTNSLDGSFGHLKGLLRVHRGASLTTKLKMIDEVLSK
jgi:hypothetical protein